MNSRIPPFPGAARSAGFSIFTECLLALFLSAILINVPGCSSIEVAVQYESDVMNRTFPEQERTGLLVNDENSNTDNATDTDQARETSPSRERIRVVVMPIQVHGEKWGGQFSDAIALHLMKTGRFDVLERSYLERVLREQHLQQTGLIDPDTGAKIGRILGARFIIVGEAIPLRYQDTAGNYHDNMVDTCTIKIIDVESAAHYAIIRKEPGIAWDWPYRFMWVLPLTMIWDREDILIDSSQYDEIASQVVTKFVNTLQYGAPGL
ncbi:MAG: hypothetical protein KDK25_12980 [Leptospiraceae bacterium]|nr:hypothetical protein [Leptospiraceae bacterium]